MQNRRPVIQTKKIDPEILARFWPPPLETFFVAVLRSLQILCLLGSGVAALAYFTQPPLVDSVWLPFAIFGAHLLSFYRGLWLEENFRPNHILVVLSELLAIFLVMWVLFILFVFSGTLFSFNFLTDFCFIAFAWQMGRSWLRHYFYIFVQPYEVSTEEGGVSTLEERRFLNFDHREAYDGLKSGWYWMAAVQILLAAISVSLANELTKDRPNREEFNNSIVIFGAIHLLLGLPLLAWLRLRYLRTNWRLSNLTMPPRLSTRWSFYLVALALVALLPVLLLSRLDFSDLIHFNSATPSQVSSALATVDANRGRFIPLTPTPPPEPPPTSEPFELPSWVGIVMLSLIVSTILFLAFLMLEKAGWVGPQWRKIYLAGAWRNFWNWLKSLFRWGRPREGFDRETGENRFDPFRRFRRERLPDDPRGRVRFHYRQMSERARKAGLPRRIGQTPDEYAEYLAPNLEEENGPELKPPLNDLTGLYDEARFSAHPIDEAQASAARQQSEALIAHLRLKARRQRGAVRKPEPPPEAQEKPPEGS